jgi:hypothetical protein
MGLSFIPRWCSSSLGSPFFESKAGVLFAVFLERERHIPCWFGTYRASWTLASIDEIDAILLRRESVRFPDVIRQILPRRFVTAYPAGVFQHS